MEQVNSQEEKLREEISLLLVRPPYISNQPGEEPDGNPILYLGDMVYVWRAHFPIRPWIGELVRLAYLEAKIEAGRISRGKHKAMDDQAHDDFIGLAYAAQETGNGWICDEIVEHGRKNFWNFEDPTEIPFRFSVEGFKEWWRDWHLRFPGLVQHYKLCSTKYQKLNIFDQFWFFLNFFLSRKRVYGSGHKMELLQRKAYLNQSHRYRLCDWGIKIFEARIREYYSNLSGSVMQAYFDRNEKLEGAPKHVFARWLQGIL